MEEAADVDRRLVDRLAAGELDALQELYERHKTMAFSIAYRITGEGAAAEDAVQDAFLGAWRNAGRYEPGRASVRTWLLTIVHRRAIDIVRRRRRPDATVEIDEDVVEQVSLPDVWEEPHAFRPERFAPEARKRIPKGAYVPFGGGSRICLGMRFGQAEIRAIATAVSERFRVELQPGFRLRIRQTPTLGPAGGLPVRIRV